MVKKLSLLSVLTSLLLFISVSVQAGYCAKWEKAEMVDLYNNSDPWCAIRGEWQDVHVARIEDQSGKLVVKCCVDWRD